MAEGEAGQDGEWGRGRCGDVQTASLSACRYDGQYMRVSCSIIDPPTCSDRVRAWPPLNRTDICRYCPGGPDSDFEYSTQSYTGYEVRVSYVAQL